MSTPTTTTPTALDEWVRRNLDHFPPLTSEQRASIASLATARAQVTGNEEARPGTNGTGQETASTADDMVPVPTHSSRRTCPRS